MLTDQPQLRFDGTYIYWDGRAVGIDMGEYVCWYPGAPQEAIQAQASPSTAGATDAKAAI